MKDKDPHFIIRALETQSIKSEAVCPMTLQSQMCQPRMTGVLTEQFEYLKAGPSSIPQADPVLSAL